MLTPRYLFTGDFAVFEPYFRTQLHQVRTFRKGDYLWAPGEPFRELHYIVSGVAQTSTAHETGRRKITSFHGSGTVFPGYHLQDFRIESAIATVALTDMQTLAFTKTQFGRMFEENAPLAAQVVEWYAMYVNLLLYETAHQEYNSTFLKLCNLLYLLAAHQPGTVLGMTQDDLADLLGVSRVQLTRALSALRGQGIIRTYRGRVEITDLSALAQHCSLETR